MKQKEIEILKAAASGKNQVMCADVEMDLPEFLNISRGLCEKGYGRMNDMYFLINDKGREIIKGL